MVAVIPVKDYVNVVDGDGNPVDGFEHPVPKSWVGTPLLLPGMKAAKKAPRTSAAPVAGGDDKTGPEGS